MCNYKKKSKKVKNHNHLDKALQLNILDKTEKVINKLIKK